MSQEGWIKIHRKIAKWEWYHDSIVVHLFYHLLLHANYEVGRWQGIDIQPGQLVTGRKSLSVQTGVSERSIRTALTKLKSTNEVTIKTNNQFSIITITNWLDYQDTDQQIGQRPTSDRPATDQRPTTIKEGKKERRKEEDTPISPNTDTENTDDDFDHFWDIYPRKESKPASRKSYDRTKTRATEDEILSGARSYALQRASAPAADRLKYTKLPATWLNNDCWNDARVREEQEEENDENLTTEEKLRKGGWRSSTI